LPVALSAAGFFYVLFVHSHYTDMEEHKLKNNQIRCVCGDCLEVMPELIMESYIVFGNKKRFISAVCFEFAVFIRAEGLIPRPLGRMKGIKSRLQYL